MFSNTKNVEKIKTQRTSKFELLRFLGAFAVILFHAAFINRQTWFYANISTFIVTPVILFIFISGFFMVNSKKTRIFKFFWILLVYYLLFALINYFFVLIKLLPIDSVNFTGPKGVWRYGSGPWWYFWTLPILYFIAPIINLAIKNLNKWYNLFVFLVIYLIYYFLTNIDYGPNLFGVGQIILFISIYMLGAWWRTNVTIDKNKLFFLIAICYLLLMIIINNILFYYFKNSVFLLIDQGKKDTSQPLTILSALSIFIIFQNIKLPYSKTINFLGKLTLPIYLFQGVFFTITEVWILPKTYLGNSVELTIFIKALLTFTLGAIFSAIIIYPTNFIIDNCENLSKNVNYALLTKFTQFYNNAFYKIKSKKKLPN